MSESKKVAFRTYLESAGAIDSLTRVLVALYEARLALGPRAQSRSPRTGA